MNVLSTDLYSVFVGHFDDYSMLAKASPDSIGGVELTVHRDGRFHVQDVPVHDSLVETAYFDHDLQRLVTKHADRTIVISELRLNKEQNRFEHTVLCKLPTQTFYYSTKVLVGTRLIFRKKYGSEVEGKKVELTELLLVDVISGSWKKVMIPEIFTPECNFVGESLLMENRCTDSIKIFKISIKENT